MSVTYVHLLRKDHKYSAYAVVAIAEEAGFEARFAESAEEALDIAKKKERVVIGVTLLTTDLLDKNYMNEVKKLVEHKPSNALVIAGGPHPSGDPWGTLAMGFDALVYGEAERSLPEFLKAVEDGADWRRVKGIFTHEGPAGLPKLADLNEHSPWPYWKGYVGPIEITRGCPFACAYCQTSFLFKAKVRHRSVERIYEYAKIMKSFGMRDLRFITPNALSYGGDGTSPELDKVEELLSTLKKVGMRIFFGSFPSEVRPEFVDDESARMLRKYVNNKRLIIGAQSASDRVLKLIHRGHTWEDVVNAVEASVRHGFVPEVDFILGLPGETEEDMLQTLKGMRRLASMGARVHLHYFMPLPGTPFAFARPTPLPPKVRKEVAKLVGEGKGWGQWMKQEELSWKIVELVEKGVIMPRGAQRLTMKFQALVGR